MSDTQKDAPQVEKVEEKGVDIPLTSDLINVIDEAYKKGLENSAKFAKKANFSGKAVDAAKAEVAEKMSKTGQFFKHLSEGNKEKAIEVSKSAWGSRYGKTLNTSDDSAIVPTEFATDLIKNMESYSQLRQNAKVRTMNAGVVKLNELDTKVTVSVPGENTGLTASEPTFTERTITARGYIGGTNWTYELEQDSEINVLAELREEFAEAFAREEQYFFLNSAVAGSEGLLQVTGTNNYDLGGSTTSGSVDFTDMTAGDIENAFAALKTLGMSRAMNAKLYLSPDILAAVSARVTASVGYQEMAKIGYENGRITRVAGLEVVEIGDTDGAGNNMLPQLSDTAVSTKFAFIADLSKTLVIGDRLGVEFEVINAGTFNSVNLNETGGRMLRGIKRTGHAVTLPENIMFLRTAAS
jgi:HK97 family phage major capsid protein